MTKKRNKKNTKKTISKKKRKGIFSVKDIKQGVLAYLGANPNKRFNFKQIATALHARNQASKNHLQRILAELLDADAIAKVSAKHYQAKVSEELMEGIVDYVNPDYGFVIVGETHDDIWVGTRQMKRALHGDKVRLKVRPAGRRKRMEGEVIEILETSKRSFVGKIEILPRFAFVEVSDRKMHQDIFVPLSKIKNAKQGEKVVVTITRWDERDKNPIGEVSQVLGVAGEHDTEIHSIIFEYDLPQEFPDEVNIEAEAIPEEITEAEIAKRRDMRSIDTFTIDPFNAKDFDDALSIRKLDNGNWEIGVHIADVTHYVQPRTDLEKEAFKRATSVYLVDRTIPMLPERLSNKLCSLRPNEEKLTFSAVFELNEEGDILDKWFGRTVIYSDRRFTYEEAQERIVSKEGDFATEINVLNELAKKIRAKRFEQGAVSFESVEFVFKLADDGKTPLGMFPKERVDAHKLIEEFMLLANKYVATYVYQLKKSEPRNTMVYRTHDDPDPDRVQEFANFAKRFGYNIEINPKKLPASLNKLAHEVEGKPEQNVLENQAIRTMAKAKYTTEGLGHYGLGFAHYTHFTSPIRRYPDMMVHRLLQYYLDGNKSAKKDEFEDKCLHSSSMEKRAADAERASVKYKQVEYMEQFVGKRMQGMISGLTEWGMYVELDETRCEGMVRLADIEGDLYQYNAEKMIAFGYNYGKEFRIGQPVDIVVKKANLELRQLDFSLVIEE